MLKKQAVFLFAILMSLCATGAFSAELKNGAGLIINHSPLLVPFGNDFSSGGEDLEAFDGAFGIEGDVLFKTSRKTYMGIVLGHYSFSVSDKMAELYPQLDLTAFSVGYKAYTFFDKPDEFTGFMSYGMTLLFYGGTAVDGTTVNGIEFEPLIDAKLGINLNYGLGLFIPITDEFSATAEGKLNLAFTQEIGIWPAIAIGGRYWF